MPIKVQCEHCGAGFKAKDELAGRRVKCPKCKQALRIGAAQTAKKQQVVAAAAHNPLLDLLDEEDVRSVARGPVCSNCGVEIAPGTVVCIECGFNAETGQQLQTEAGVDDLSAGASASMTDAERIMAKAERDIDDMPITSDDQDFGDGSESYLIAAIAAVMGVILIAIGMTVIFSMEKLSESVSSAGISLVASIALYVAMGVWISLVAFKISSLQGIVCVCTGFLWCSVFGFMQGKALLMPTIVLIVTLVMMLATGTYVSYNGFAPPPEV